MRIIVDTNILVRILIKQDGVVAGLFYPLKNIHELYVSSESLEEISKHKLRLIRSSRLSKEDFEELYNIIISNISIVPVSIIPTEFFVAALRLTSSVDNSDIPFVATALFLEGILWTSDKPLFDSIKRTATKLVVSNNDIKLLLNKESR